MSSIILKNIGLYGERKDIVIGGNTINHILPSGSATPSPHAEVVDCTGREAIPGLINMHTHAGMSLMRGIGEDLVFPDWISKIWDIEEHIDYDFVYWSTKVAILEMIRSGTTTFNDQYWFFKSSRRAAEEMGIRIATGYDIMDKGSAAEAQRQREQCLRTTEDTLNHCSDRLLYQLAFHAVYSVSEDMILWVDELSRKHGLNLHIHLSETRKEVEDCKAAHGGLTPVEYLDSLGVLSPRLIAAHTLWLTPHDIELLARNGVHCVHNINSNTKLCSGYRFLYNELRDAGVNICIGTDGAASSNNLDLLEAMKTSALFQKAWRDDPKALPLDELMSMATINGANALKINAGKIEEGREADICIVNTDSPAFLSAGPFQANLIYSAHSDCIESVIAAGKFIMKERRIEGEEEILHEARKVLSKIK